uniref:Lysozyme n=1 Tax=Ditylenchus destructor TaxID=166010 RepID=H6SWQ7_9BILA|nr:lysozyme [Ditylenchus destructor]
MLLAVLLLALLCALHSSLACQTGFDSDQLIAQADMQCLKTNGYTYFIGQIYKGDGTVNQNGVNSIKNARAAGYTGLVDAYVTPCVNKTKYSCKSATQQAADAINNLLRTSGAHIGRVWLQVVAGEWPNDPTANRKFMEDFAAQVIKQKPQFGVQTNQNDFVSVGGSGYTGMQQYQLWWNQLNNGIADYIGYVGFSGWAIPSMHQYNRNGKLNANCNPTANQDWFF